MGRIAPSQECNDAVTRQGGLRSDRNVRKGGEASGAGAASGKGVPAAQTFRTRCVLASVCTADIDAQPHVPC